MSATALGLSALLIGAAGALLAVLARETAAKLIGVSLLVAAVALVGSAASSVKGPPQTPIGPVLPVAAGVGNPTGPSASPRGPSLALPKGVTGGQAKPTPTPTRPPQTPVPGPTGH